MFLLESLLTAVLLAQQAPVPQPFPQPGAGRPPAPSTPAAPSTPPAAPSPAQPPAVAKPADSEAAPSEATLGVPIYPAAQFLTSFDAGRGQRFYLFGSTASFLDLVTWYRVILKQRGELVFDAPATHEFELGRFRQETMAFPPSVTIKEFKSEISAGYPNPKAGVEPARFPTVIQIVPAPEGKP
jgi:hypothetical protein